MSLSSLLEGMFNWEETTAQHSNGNDTRKPMFAFSLGGIVAHMETPFNFLK